MDKNAKLLVFGDSHSTIWEGNLHHYPKKSRFNGVEAVHLGPALAYNLLDSAGNDLGKWGIQVTEYLSKFLKTETDLYVMLSFGEIDIRTQVIQRAIQEDLSIEESVEKIVKRLVKFSEILYDIFEVPILIWEPIPSAMNEFDPYNPEFPEVGSLIERCYAAQCFSKISRQKSIELQETGKKIYSFGINDVLIHLLETKSDYYKDGCHLNLKGLELAISSLTKLCINSGLEVYKLFNPYAKISGKNKLVNISSKIEISLSSIYNNEPAQLMRQPNKGYCFHTNKDVEPFALLDIGYSSKVKKIVIFNRFDFEFERAKSLVIMIGNDIDKLEIIHSVNSPWGFQGDSIAIEFENSFRSFRYIAFKLLEQEFFHLGEIQIFELSFCS